MLRTLVLALACLLAAAVPAGAAPPDDELDAAAAELRDALSRGTRERRLAALDALVALEDDAAVEVLQAHLADASQALRERRDGIVETTYVLERKREMIATMKVRLERDPGLADVVAQLEEERAELEGALRELEVEARGKERLAQDLGEAAERLFERFGRGQRRKAEKALWKDAEKHPEQGVRIAAVELLGRFGSDDAATRLHELLLDVARERRDLKDELPELEADLREFEERFQREQDQNEGRASRATSQQYERLRAEPAAIRRELHKLAFLLDAAAEAGGRALARERGDQLDDSLGTLLKAAESTRGATRALTLDLLAHADADPVRARLRELLAEAEEPLARAQIVDALARLGDQAVVRALIDEHLVAESWHVRSRAAAALATLRSKRAIPALIERVAAEEGRVKTDALHALESLTGQRFGSNAAVWRRWWAEEGEAFEVPPEPPEPEGSLSAEEAVGVTFFGIRTESRRVLFVLDVSRSMNFSMVPRNNPNDDLSGGREPDWPREGEDSRLDVAKRQLVKALGGIGEGGVVNIVLYATDVWSWRDDPVEVDVETRSQVVRYVEALTANGGTNLYGALKHAFDLAGVEEEGEWADPLVDTIYVLSDGRASVGLTTDPDEILAYVRERNRAAGITIHTIGLSGAQDAYLLRSLAEENGGQYAAK